MSNEMNNIIGPFAGDDRRYNKNKKPVKYVKDQFGVNTEE